MPDLTINQRIEHWLDLPGYDEQGKPQTLRLRSLDNVDHDGTIANVQLEIRGSTFTWAGNYEELLEAIEIAQALDADTSFSELHRPVTSSPS